jgi:hypothetical protein
MLPDCFYPSSDPLAASHFFAYSSFIWYSNLSCSYKFSRSISGSYNVDVALAPFRGSLVFLGGYLSFTHILAHLLRYLLRFDAVSCCDSGTYSSVVVALVLPLVPIQLICTYYLDSSRPSAVPPMVQRAPVQHDYRSHNWSSKWLCLSSPLSFFPTGLSQWFILRWLIYFHCLSFGLGLAIAHNTWIRLWRFRLDLAMFPTLSSCLWCTSGTHAALAVAVTLSLALVLALILTTDFDSLSLSLCGSRFAVPSIPCSPFFWPWLSSQTMEVLLRESKGDDKEPQIS